MTSSSDLDPKIRFIVLYQDAQMKSTRISKVLNVPLRTVQDWIQKIDNNVDILNPQRNNISKQVNEEVKMNIETEMNTTSRVISTRTLGAKYNLSHTAVRNVLTEKGFKYKPPDKNAFLTEEEMDDRVDYCKDMVKYHGRKIKRCFFSDEMGIRLSELYKPRKHWMQEGMKIKNQRICEKIKLNCWGAISWNGATSLHIYSENLNNALYQEIVEKHRKEMENLYPLRDFSYQHDNHPTHLTFEVFDEDENIEIIDFPTYSPDLNPVENVWSTLKYKVACDAPESEDELKRSLKKNWKRITKIENLRPYLETLESR